MTKKEFTERVTNLNALIKVLATVDEDNPAISDMPLALKVVSEYSETIYQAIAEDNITA